MTHYVVFVHGIGEQKKTEYDAFMERLRSLFPPGQFNFEVAYWAGVVQPDEDRLKKLTHRKGFLNDFLIGGFGDVVGYSGLDSPYTHGRSEEIQKKVTEAISKMGNKANEHNDKDAQLSVIGHSLGSVIASDCLYNMINNKSDNHMPENLTFNSFFTFGSPIALWGLRYGLKNFTKPIQPKKVWLNFYYPQDIVAFPLKELDSGYGSAVKEDIRLSPPNFIRRLTALLPLARIASHSWYFSDETMLQRIAKEMKDG